MSPHILALDIAGAPHRWINVRDAAHYYCAQRFRLDQLDMEHIVPSSKGGEASWMNLVAACKACNHRKGDRTPEAAGMKLHYVPYVPNRYEAFILSNRKILADQMEFLLQGVPKSSRMHAAT
jgi:hypothetical protein